MTEQSVKPPLDVAIMLAVAAHRGQMSRDDVEPQLCHVLRVMAAGRTEDERVVGALHDVIEDSDMTEDVLRSHGFSEAVVEAVSVLTRREPWTYSDYIALVATNPLATAVKCHDLRDNIARGAAYPTLVRRYHKALTVLEPAAPLAGSGERDRTFQDRVLAVVFAPGTEVRQAFAASHVVVVNGLTLQDACESTARECFNVLFEEEDAALRGEGERS